jgi:hypothetical protein
MAKKRPDFSFPELEHRGRNAILRSTAEVEAEEALLTRADAGDATGDLPLAEPTTPAAPRVKRRPVQPALPEPPSDPRADSEDGSTPAPMRARTRAPKAGPAGVVTERLRQKLRTKQHLSSYTFRFRPEELEQLDQLVGELNHTRTSKLSKNDLVRLALGWLLTDYEEYGQASLVVEVTRQE